MENIIAVFIVFTSRFMIPLSFWLAKYEVISTDAWSHVCSAILMKRRGHKPFMRMPNTEESGEDYPWLYFWFLSFFPERWIMRVGMLTGTIFDTLLFVLFLIVLSVIGGPQTLYGFDVYVLALIFSFTPHFTRRTTGKLFPRPRPMGILFGNCIMFLLVVYSQAHNPYIYGVAVLLYVPLCLSSKFAVQAIVGIPFVFGIIAQDIFIILYPLIAVVVSALLTFGESWKLLKGQIKHSVVYWTKGYHVVKSFNTVYIPEKINKKELLLVFKHLSENAYFQVLTGLPLIFFMLYYFTSGKLPLDQYGTKMVIWLLSGAVIMLLTSRWKLKVFGQAERYIDFCMIPYMFLTALIIPVMGYGVIGLVILYGIVMMVIQLYVRFKYLGIKSGQIENIINGYKWLDQIPETSRVISISFPYSRIGLIYSKHIYPFTQGISYKKRSEFEAIYSRYPYPHEDLTGLINEHKIDYVVKIKRMTKDKLFYPLKDKIYENAEVEIFDVRQFHRGMA